MQYFIIREGEGVFPDKLIGPMSEKQARGFKQGWTAHPGVDVPGSVPSQHPTQLIGPIEADRIDELSEEEYTYKQDGGEITFGVADGRELAQGIEPQVVT